MQGIQHCLDIYHSEAVVPLFPVQVSVGAPCHRRKYSKKLIVGVAKSPLPSMIGREGSEQRLLPHFSKRWRQSAVLPASQPIV